MQRIFVYIHQIRTELTVSLRFDQWWRPISCYIIFCGYIYVCKVSVMLHEREYPLRWCINIVLGITCIYFVDNHYTDACGYTNVRPREGEVLTGRSDPWDELGIGWAVLFSIFIRPCVFLTVNAIGNKIWIYVALI